MKAVRFLHLLLLWEVTTGLNGRTTDAGISQKPTIYIITMVPFPNDDRPTWAMPNYDAGHSILPAAQLAVDQINNRSDILADYNLELLVGDSGCNVDTNTYLSQVIQILYSNKPVVGMVGPACSEASLAVAALNTRERLGVVHVMTGSIPLLDDREKYPYTFGMISSSTSHVSVIFELMRLNEWNRVAILYDIFRPYYFRTYLAFLDQLEENRRSGKTQTNVIFAGGITQTFFHLNEISDNGTRVIIVMSSATPARRLVCLAAHLGITYPAYQFVFQDRRVAHFISEEEEVTVNGYRCNRDMMMRGINGSILLHFGLTSIANETITISKLSVQDVREEYQRRVQDYGEQIGMNLTATDFAYSFYDAVWAMALSVNNSIPQLNESLLNISVFDTQTSEVIRNQFYNLDFQGATVNVKFNNQTGHVRSIVDIHQADFGKMKLIKLWDGRELLNVTNSSLGEFVKDTFESRKVTLHLALVAIGLSVATITFAITVLLQVVIFIFHDYNSIKASSPRLNPIIVSGCFMITISIVVYTIQVGFLPNLTTSRIAGSVFCNVFAWCVNIGYTLIIGTILVKLWRLNRVFFHSFQKQFLSDKVMILIIAILMLLEVALCVVWVAVSPLTEVESRTLGKEGDMSVIIVELRCDTKYDWFVGIVAIYKVLLTAVVVYYSIRNRSIKKQFRSTRSVNVMLYAVTLLWGLGGTLWAILFVRRTEVNILYCIMLVLLTLTALLSLLFLLVPPIIPLVEERWHRGKFSRKTWRRLSMVGLRALKLE